MLKNGPDANDKSLLLLIFGGTGDLTHRKLLPALYHLLAENRLPEECSVISIGRKPHTEEAYRDMARDSIQKHSRTGVDAARMDKFLSRLHYRSMEFIEDPASYKDLRGWLDENEALMAKPSVRLFFLAVAPEFFGLIVTRLRENGLITKRNPDHRVMIE